MQMTKRRVSSAITEGRQLQRRLFQPENDDAKQAGGLAMLQGQLGAVRARRVASGM